jgi:hypothetical protein
VLRSGLGWGLRTLVLVHRQFVCVGLVYVGFGLEGERGRGVDADTETGTGTGTETERWTQEPSPPSLR